MLTKVCDSNEPAFPACFLYSYTDIESTILGYTTSRTVIEVQKSANNPTTSLTTSLSSASSSLISQVYGETTTFTGFSDWSTPIAGHVTVGSFQSSGNQTSTTMWRQHLGVITAGAVVGFLALVVLVGLISYFFLRKKNDGFVALGQPQEITNTRANNQISQNLRGSNSYTGI